MGRRIPDALYSCTVCIKRGIIFEAKSMSVVEKLHFNSRGHFDFDPPGYNL